MTHYLRGLECTQCGTGYPGDSARALCECGRSLFARYDLAAIRSAVSPKEIATRAPSLWRYQELLPVAREEHVVSMGEGCTPLVPVPRLARELGVGECLIKDEGLNPTGTFKARGAAVAISRWKELGVTKVCQPTVGSGGHAWAAYGARAGVEVHTAMPVDVPDIGWKGCALNGARV